MARVEPGFRVFFVFPFTHSEDAADQALSMALSARIDPGRAERVSGHRDIIRRFGRFPHRNPLLGRGHTPDEAASLGEGGFAGWAEVVAAATAWIGRSAEHRDGNGCVQSCSSRGSPDHKK